MVISKKTVAIELPMTGSSDSSPRCRVDDVVFMPNGTVHFANLDRVYHDCTPVRYEEEHGLKARRKQGIGKVLFIRRPDRIVQKYQYVGGIWFQLVPSEYEPGIFHEAIRLLRHHGPSCARQFAALLLVLGVFLGLFAAYIWYGSSESSPEAPIPVYRPNEVESPPIVLTPEVASYVGGIAFLDDGSTLVATGGEYITWWDTRSVKRKRTEEAPGQIPPALTFIAASPSARLNGRIACVADGDVLLWDDAQRWIRRPEPVPAPLPPDYGSRAPELWVEPPVRESTFTVTALAYSPDGQLIATAGGDYGDVLGTVELLRADDLTSIAKFQQPGPCSSVAFSYDGTTLAAATSDERVHLFDVQTRRLTGTLEPPRGPSQWVGNAEVAIALSPVSGDLATAGMECKVHLWDINSRSHREKVDVKGRITSLCFAPDGRHIAAICSNGLCDQLLLVDMNTKAVVAAVTPHVSSTMCKFSPDGQFICVSGLHRIQLFRFADVLKQSKLHTQENQTKYGR